MENYILIKKKIERYAKINFQVREFESNLYCLLKEFKTIYINKMRNSIY
jgi:hypothetical protein